VPAVDVVVVAYRSGRDLRDCVEPLTNQPELTVTVVDNADPDRSADTVRDLPLTVVEMGRNAGFGAGCNAGAAEGSAPAILFLNPDARIAPADALRLADALDDTKAAAGPRIDGELSIRRFPSLTTVYAEALFVHHLLPKTSELVHTGYDEPHEADWLTGAVLAVRRKAFDEVGGFDERFFMYSEETDLCRRLRDRGYTIWYEPAAHATHEGGASAPRSTLVPRKTESRILYARLHERGARYAAFRVGIAAHDLLRRARR
jgi:GT2 family glycosyltransferase